MTPAEYQRLVELFERALKLPAADRKGFAEKQCRGDPALRGELESMLQADEDGEIFESSPGPTEPEELDPSLSGGRVLRYNVLERIGEGGMAVVYRAEDVELRRSVALKFLSPFLNYSEEARERFLREARTAAAIDHPNVCPIYEVSAEGGRPFIAMAFLEGRTVADALRAGPMDVDAAVDVAIQACRGLEAAHAKGIVHRDIKPSNLMLVRPATGAARNLVKILDFGVASYERERTITAPGMSLGTLGYMSPEQIASEEIDQRSDLWSLGATLYEMLAARPPFNRATMRESIAAIAGAESTPLRELRGEIPLAVERVVKRLLRKEPEERFQSAAELAQALEDVQQQQRTGTLRSPLIRSPAKPPWQQTAIGAGLLLVAAAVFWALADLEPVKAPQGELLESVPITSYPGVEAYPALSPDGDAVAFSWDGGGGGQKDLYVQQIGAYEPRRLTDTTETEGCSTWSPDGEKIAFVRSTHKVFVIPASGGAEQLILELSDGNVVRDLDWSPKGDLLLVGGDKMSLGVRLADPNAAPIRYELSGFTGVFPRFDPSGERVALVGRGDQSSHTEFAVLPASGDQSAARRFRDADHSANNRRFDWSADGERLIYSQERESPFFALHLEDGHVETLPIRAPDSSWLDVRGGLLAYGSRVRWISNIWAADLGRARSTGMPVEPRPLIQSSRRQDNARFSPDGRSIIFESDRSGVMEFWRCDRDGGNVRKLTSIGNWHLGSPVWSADGDWIAFDASIDDHERDIYVVSADGGAPRRLTRSPAGDIVPSWSADSGSIYFASNRGGDFDIWRMPAEGGEAERMTTGGGFETLPTPDGRFLYYSVHGPFLVRRRDLSTGEEIAFPELGSAGFRRSWYPVEDGIYFRDESGPEPEWIQFLDFETRSARKICAFGEQEPGPRQISVSPDGRTLLFTQRDEYGEDIMLVEGLELR